jgi:hypothetical protein
LSGLPGAWFATRGLAFDDVRYYDAAGRLTAAEYRP